MKMMEIDPKKFKDIETINLKDEGFKTKVEEVVAFVKGKITAAGSVENFLKMM